MSKMQQSILGKITKERAVGSANNNEIGTFIKQQLQSFGYQIEEIPFDCTVWEHGSSVMTIGDTEYQINISPFSEGFEGEREIIVVSSLEELENCDCNDCILILGNDIAKEQIQPKDFPFYFPPEHQKLISLLESKRPAAIIAATGKAMESGLEPFPMFCDGNFLIPSGCLHEKYFGQLCAYPKGSKAYVKIQSGKKKGKSSQLIARKDAVSGQNKGKIVLCAHMDTQYDTDGALDNASGIAVMLEAAKRLQSQEYSIEVVPMNGEEYYESTGELLYLQYNEKSQEKTSLVINIDSPCHIGAGIGYSLYNFTDQQSDWMKQRLTKHPAVSEGEQWYAGDHAMFAFAGTPCVAVSSSDLFTGALNDTHTKRDVIEHIDEALIPVTANWICELVSKASELNLGSGSSCR